MLKLTQDQKDNMRAYKVKSYDNREGFNFYKYSEQERYCSRVERYSNQCESRDVWIYGLDLD